MQQKLIRGPAKVTGIHSSGKGIVAFGNKNTYLSNVIPGEEIYYISGPRRLGFRTGELTDVLIKSPWRVDPFCLHHSKCSGCPWQHIAYEHQLELKRLILCNALEKYAINTPPVPAVNPSPLLHHYRHRVEYTFSNTPALGFHRFGEPGQIIDIQECHLQEEPSRPVCEFIRSYGIEHKLDFYDHRSKTGFLRSLSIRTTGSELMVLVGFSEDRPAERELLLSSLIKEFPSITSLCWTIHLSPENSQLQGKIFPFHGAGPYIHEQLGDLSFSIHASSFFQPNPRQALKIFETIREWAELKGDEFIVDLYTGVGTIALFLAPYARHVTGIEGIPEAIEDAKTNAAGNCIHNATFLTGDILETFRPEFISKHGKPDIIVLDPPRSGTLIEIKKTINASGAGKVIYLSCNPVSLAFDLKQLTEIYRVTRIQPFDMLPHTHHLETLVMLEKT